MTKRKHDEVRKAILKALSDGETRSYGYLERKVNTNWKTIRDHCKDLEVFNAILISEGRVKITKEGREALKKLKMK